MADQLKADGNDVINFASCVQVANGDSVELTKKITVLQFFDEIKIIHDFVIFPGLAESVIIGMDFLQKISMKMT